MKPSDFGYKLANNICFFHKGPLSNWYGAYKGQNGGFRFGGNNFNCIEQWMMFQKALVFDDTESAELIIAEKNPKTQKQLGRGVKNYDDSLWAECRFEIVKMGITKKFQANEAEREFLLGFHPHTIFCEAAPWDKIWGNGLSIDDPKALEVKNWSGANLLGRIISEVRWNYYLDSLRKK